VNKIPLLIPRGDSGKMLRKYIKAEQLQVVEKITEKYDYFD